MARQITIDAIRAFNNNYKFKRSNIVQKDYTWYLNGNAWNGETVRLEDWGLFVPVTPTNNYY